MSKITQLFTDSFKKIKEKVTNSSSKKDTKYGTIEKHESTHEVRAETREKMIQTTQEIRSQIRDSSSKAKIESSKKLNKTPMKKLSSIKTVSPKKNSLKTATEKLTSQSPTKITSKSSVKKTSNKSPKKELKKEISVPSSKKIPKKTIIKNTPDTTQSMYISFPSGKIVNSVVLSEVERGYLELAGFKNYKDAFIGLDSSTKRSKIAKQIATQATTVSNILKKLELLQVKGIGENLAFVLTRLEISSLQKLVKADSSKLIKKVQNYSKAHPDVDIKLSQKQLDKLQQEAKKTPTSF